MATRNVSFYGDMGQALGGGSIQRDYMMDPRRTMAQQLMEQGSSTAPVQSPLEGLTRALTAGVGGYFGGKARKEMSDREKLAAQQMQQVLGGGDYQGMMDRFNSLENPDPSLQGFGSEIAMQQMAQQQAAEQAAAERQAGREDYLFQQQNKAQPKIPGRDVPYAPEVASQLTDIAGAKAAALRPSFESVPGMTGVQQDTKTGELKAAPLTPEQKSQAKIAELQPKALSALQGLERQTNTVTTHIDKALGLISPWSTGYGAALSFLPESDARELRNELDTIKANVGFDKLQAMRDASPTGGALGQVSEMENRLLQAVNGALDPAQSNQLKENLAAIREIYPQVLEERKSAYEADYGKTYNNQKQNMEYDFIPGRGLVPRGQ